MNAHLNLIDYIDKEIVVVYKQSRLAFSKELGALNENPALLDMSDPINKELFKAHDNNLRCIEMVIALLTSLGKKYRIIGRADLTKEVLANKLIITVGGDGTLLDTSHYCKNSPILGVNSDPDYSIGALCAASPSTIQELLINILENQLKPSALTRLSIKIGDETIEPLALNDVLFCHSNPASVSRFILSFKNETEAYRSSGIWVATPAGSTGGIYSSGGKALPLNASHAIFRLREPYWSDKTQPKFLNGIIAKNNVLKIQSTMTEGEIFIDGSHKTYPLSFKDVVEIRLAKAPLWLFNGPLLIANRDNLIKRRKVFRNYI